MQNLPCAMQQSRHCPQEAIKHLKHVCYKCKINADFENNVKRDVKLPQYFLYWLCFEMMILGYNRLNKIYENYFPTFFFYLFNVSKRKFKFTYMAYFILDPFDPYEVLPTHDNKIISSQQKMRTQQYLVARACLSSSSKNGSQLLRHRFKRRGTLFCIG